MAKRDTKRTSVAKSATDCIKIATMTDVPAELRAQIIANAPEVRERENQAGARHTAHIRHAVDAERLRAEGLGYAADDLLEAIHHISPEDVVDVSGAAFNDRDDFRTIHTAHAELVAAYERWVAVGAQSMRNRDSARRPAQEAEQAEWMKACSATAGNC